MGNLFDRIKGVVKKLASIPRAYLREPPEEGGAELPEPDEITYAEKDQYLSHANIVHILRVAAKKKLLVRLRYHDKYRYVESYSFRAGKSGLLYFGHEIEGNDTRSYYLYKIQSVQLTDIPYNPRWYIEL